MVRSTSITSYQTSIKIIVDMWAVWTLLNYLERYLLIIILFLFKTSFATIAIPKQITDDPTLSTNCITSYKNGSLILNPCGLIANSFFTGLYFLFLRVKDCKAQRFRYYWIECEFEHSIFRFSRRIWHCMVLRLHQVQAGISKSVNIYYSQITNHHLGRVNTGDWVQVRSGAQ